MKIQLLEVAKVELDEAIDYFNCARKASIFIIILSMGLGF